MTKFDYIPDRAMQLAGQLGDNLRHAMPDGAGKWLDAGMKLGAIKAGTRVASTFVRRNPAAFAAAAAGAGVLWYLARRRAKQAENGTGNGQSTRVEAKRGTGSTRSTTPRARKSRARKATKTTG